MSGAASALYAPLIERDFDALPRAVEAFLAEQAPGELWLAVTRFAVLAFAPSAHSKRALMACRAAGELGAGVSLVVECARYAASSRPPWSEPPLLDPPEVGADPGTLAEALGDRLRAERWLAAHLDGAADELRAAAEGDALLLLDTAVALEPKLGAAGRFALYRTVIVEMVATPRSVEALRSPSPALAELIARAGREQGSIESVTDVFVAEARARLHSSSPARPLSRIASPPPYRLARDFAQTLIAHAVAARLEERDAGRLLAAVRENLEHGESFEDWSLA